MASVDSELESGEHVLFRTGSHPLAFSGAAMMALFVALVVTLLIRHNDLPAGTELRIALSGLLVAVLGAIPSALRWRNTVLAVTDRRILATAGGLRRRALAVPLGPGVVDQDAGVTGRLLDHGTVVIAAPNGSSTSFRHVARARELVEVARAQARRVGRRGSGAG
jgi:hypothetical protein